MTCHTCHSVTREMSRMAHLENWKKCLIFPILNHPLIHPLFSTPINILVYQRKYLKFYWGCSSPEKLLSYAMHANSWRLLKEKLPKQSSVLVQSSDWLIGIRENSSDLSSDGTWFPDFSLKSMEARNLPTETTRRISWPHPSSQEAPRRQEHCPLGKQAIWCTDHMLPCTARAQRHRPSTTALHCGQWKLKKAIHR